MAFHEFRYPAVVRDLGLTERLDDLFPGVPPRPPGPVADTVLAAGRGLAVHVNTAKARSEWLVAPVLLDLWAQLGRRINLHSGAGLVGDPDAGLVGTCDFLIGRGPQLPHVAAPAVVLFAAKNEGIQSGYGQAIAAMVGAQRFNAREGTPIDPVYGCSTTGSLWQFLRLSGTDLAIDRTEYPIAQVDRILGILAHMAGPPAG